MPYTPLNPSIKFKQRADARAKKRSANFLKTGQRYEFIKGMYGNTYEVVDHKGMHYYRQDRPVINQGDLFDGFLPFSCDYCRQIVNEIYPIHYKAVYEMLVCPNHNPRWHKDTYPIIFSCCSACHYGPLPIPDKMIGHHLTELYQDDRLVFSQEKKR